MTNDIRTAVYDLGRAFEQFKDANDQRIREMERRGSADPLTEMKVNRLNAEISRASDAADAASVFASTVSIDAAAGMTGAESARTAVAASLRASCFILLLI